MFECCCAARQQTTSETALVAVNTLEDEDEDAEDLPQLQDTVREAQMKTIRENVISFVKNGIKGTSCVYINERAASRLPGKYFFDSSATKFIVRTGEDLSQEEVVCPIGSISNLYRVEIDGEECFPEVVRSKLRPQDIRRVLMVRFLDTQDGTSQKKIHFCILLESCAARDKCLQCLDILKRYAAEASTRGVHQV